MKKRILDYRGKIDNLLEKNAPDTDWEAVLSEHLVQIGFFQHERLVHLIVTITFAILTMLAMLGCFLTDTPAMLVLTLLCLVLLVPYVRHYYILENGVQRLYRDYDALNRE